MKYISIIAAFVAAFLFFTAPTCGNRSVEVTGNETVQSASALPEGFVSLSEVIPDIILEIRYAGSYNFTGVPIDGYNAPLAFMTRQAADSLKAVSEEVKALGYRLKVYDAYRPQRAVDHFVRWASDPDDVKMQQYFYPEEQKNRLFKRGYIAKKSGHSRGSTIDLTLFDMASGKEVDMGGTFDWFGQESHTDFCGDPGTDTYHPSEAARESRGITEQQFHNRVILRRAMMHHGFRPISTEWWHFTLLNEPYPDTYFDFPVE